MVSIAQYPHYLFAVETTESQRDDDGNWQPESTVIVYKGKCREETNGKGSQIQLAGGNFHIFNSLIQAPKGSLKLAEGTEIIVADDAGGEEIRIKSEVLKFDKGQLHSRIWV